mmetsp:Transcript_1095/g.2973  ORF Transcript_1095/g.2973 Transcript_1095/m.2973 type:complete len:314 (-) Transcript_1095:1326-2267(-)
MGRCFRRHLGHRRHLGLLLVEGRDVGHVLVAQRGGLAVHRRMLAVALGIGLQRRHDVLGVLPGQHRHLVDLGEARLIARNAVAADAVRDLLFTRLGVLGLGGKCAKQGGQNERHLQQFFHVSFGVGCISGGDYRRPPILIRPPPSPGFPDEISRFRPVRRHGRPDARGACRGHTAAPAADQGRARHRQDDAGRGGRCRTRHAAAAMAYQEHHQGPAGPVRVRRRQPSAGLAARRHRRQRPRPQHRELHRQGRALAGLRGRPARGAADRRDRQGRHRVPERPAARNRPDGVLRVRDAPAGQGQAPAAGLHHVQQ